jgi:hypothetical protein
MRGYYLSTFAGARRRPITVAGTNLLLFAESGISLGVADAPVVTDAKRYKLGATGFMPVSGATDPRTAYNDATYLGNFIQPAATYQIALPLDDVDAPNTSGDPLYFTKSVTGDTIAYPGDHSEASIFAGTGKGVRFVRSGTGTNSYRAPNVVLTGLSSGTVFRQAVILTIETTVAGSIGLRSYGGLTDTVTFTHDDEGKVTGENSAWSLERAGFLNLDFLINGKQAVLCWVDRVATGTGDIDFGLDITSGAGATALHVYSFAGQVAPADWPTAVPVTATGSYAADAVNTGITSQVGFILDGVHVCRSRAPSGVIAPPAFDVGGAYLPICTRIRVVNTSAVSADRGGLMIGSQYGLARRPWRSPAAFNLNLGPVRVPRQFVDVNGSGETVTDVNVRPVFEGRFDLLPILGNTGTSQTFLLGNLDVSGNILLVQGDHTITNYYQQISIRANTGSFDLRAVGNVTAQNCLFMGNTPWPTRASHEVQRDEGTRGRIWVGEVGFQTSGGAANAGATISVDGTRTHRLSRITFNGVASTTNVALSYNDVCATEPWMDVFYNGQMNCTRRDAARVTVLRHTARMDTSMFQSERAIQITRDGGATWDDIDFAVDPIATLPHGINAAKVGTYDFDTSTFTSAPDATRVLPIRFYYNASASSPTISKPGFQFICSQMEIGNYSTFPTSGEVFRWTDPDDSDFQLEFTAQRGRWTATGYQRLGTGVMPTLAVTESPDIEQWNRFGITATGAVGNYDATDWFVISRGTGQFVTGGTWSTTTGAPPTNSSAYDNFRTIRMFYMADAKQDPFGFDWSSALASNMLVQDHLAIQAAGLFTFSNGSGTTMVAGVAGPRNTLTLDNVTVLTSAGTAVAIQNEGTLVGTAKRVPARFRRDFSTFDALPEGSEAPLYLRAEDYNAEQGCANMPSLADCWNFRVPQYAIDTEGWDINAMIVDAIGDHRRWDTRIAQIEATHHREPDFKASTVNNVAIGTVLATGITGQFERYTGGNDIEQLYEIVGGELRTAKLLIGLEQIDWLTTDAGELIKVDIRVPDSVAPTITGLSVSGTPQNSQTLTFSYTTAGFPDPAVTGEVILLLDDVPVVVDTFTGTASSATYVLDAGDLATVDGDIITFVFTAANAVGSDNASVAVEFDVAETPPLSTDEDDLIAALLAGGGKSGYYRLNEAGLFSGTLIADDLSGLSNDLSQATSGSQPSIGTGGATFDATDFLPLTITGGTFTVVMSFTKADASTSGAMMADQSQNVIAQYQSGDGTSTDPSTTSVGGTVRTTRGAIYTALHTTGEQLVKMASADFTNATQIRLGRGSSSMVGTVRRVVILDHAALGGGLAAAVALAETVVMAT